ncbi:M14 metallopeptidase family protein [candidate division KSB1 bacterium]
MTARRIAVIVLFLLFSQSLFAFQEGTVPTPESIIGFRPGTDYKLANWEQISTYFMEIAQASDRIEVFDIGATEMDNRMLMAVISSSENLRNIGRIKEIQHKLADPRITPESELPSLVREGKAVVLMTFSLHATEVGATQMSPLLAYQLATDNSSTIREILDNVVLVLFPCANPDGVMLVADHYMNQNPGPGVDIESLPRVYNKYTGHDNNRDWYMMTQKETRLIANQLYKEWLPEIVMDMHQMGNSGARFFLPPFADPLNPVIHPHVVRELQMLGGYFNTELIEGGYPWVENMSGYTMWWHGGMRTAPYFHNMVGILSEAASANLATPVPASQRSAPAPTINYTVPWQHDRAWRIGDIVEQDRIAALAVLKGAAKNREMFIRNFYTMNKDAVEKGRTEPPYAYVMPAGQHDPGALRYFLEIMLRQKTEFFEATDDFSAGGNRYRAGSIIAYLAQPSRPHVEAIFGIQEYPEDAGRPYDITGWTLPVQMGVQYNMIERSFSARTRPYTLAAHRLVGDMDEEISTYILGANSIDHYKAVNRFLAGGHSVYMLLEPVSVSGRVLPAGTKILNHSRNLERDMQELTSDLTIELRGIPERVRENTVEINKPRIAMIDNPRSMPVGWLRWIMDTNEYEYTLLDDEGVRAGSLSSQFDVILFPATIGSESGRGQQPGAIPDGIKRNLRDFVESEGIIVAWGDNANFVIRALDLTVESAIPEGSGADFSIPGSILKTTIDTNNPFTYGMQEQAFVFYGRGATAWKSGSGQILGHYPDENPLYSGFAMGSQYIRNTPNVLNVEIGNGSAVLIGFDPVFRAQPVGTFKLLFNAIIKSSY